MSLYGTSVAVGDLEHAWFCFWAWQPFLTFSNNDSYLGKMKNINRFLEGYVSRLKIEKALAGIRKE